MRSIFRAAVPFIATAVVTAATVGVGITLLQDQCWDCPEPLPCPEQADTFYITVTEGAEGSAVSHVGTLDLTSGAVTPLSSKATHNLDLNALAFNQTDRLLYAMTHDHQFVRLDKNGEIKQTWDLSAVLPDTDSTPGADGLYRAATSGWAVANQYWAVRSVPDPASPTGYRSTHLVVLKIPIVNSNDPVTLSHVYPIASTSPMMDLQDIAWNKTVHVGNNPPSPNYAFIGYDGVSDQLVGNLGGGGSQFTVDYLPVEGTGASAGEDLGALAFISTGASHQPWLFGEPTNAGFGNDQNTVFVADIDDDASDPNDLHSITSVATHQTDWTNTDGASCIESEAVTSTIDSFKCPSVFFANAYPNNTASWSTLTRLDPDTQAVVTGWLSLGMDPNDPALISDEDWNAIGIQPSGSMNVLMYAVRAYDSNATPPALPEIYSITPAPEPNVAYLGFAQDPGQLAVTGTNNQNGQNGTVTHPDQSPGANALNGRYFAGTFAWVNGQWEYVLLRSRSNQDVSPNQGTFTTFSQQTHMVTIDVLDPNGPTVTGVIVLPRRWQVPGTSIQVGVDTGDIAADSMNPTLMYGLGFVGDIDNSDGLGVDDPGTILRFDLNGNVVPVTTIWAQGEDGATLAGSAFFDLQGDFWIVTRTGDQLTNQDLLIEFNVVRDSNGAIVQATEARRVQFTPALAGGTDGAGCPFTKFDWSTGPNPNPQGDFYEIAEQEFCVLTEGDGVATVNLYQQPDSSSPVAGTADSVTTVRTTGRAFRSSGNEIWFEVRSGGTVGWVLAVQLAEGECQTPEDPDDEGEYSEIERTEWCADPGVELRDEPDATASPTISVAGSISNSGLAYTDSNGVVWVEVRVGLQSGWVRAVQLVEGPCEEPTTTTVGGTEAGDRQTEACEGYEGDLEGEQLEAAIAFLHGTGFNVILGTDDDDSLIGTDSADAIFGRGGDDEIDGFGGNDCLFGGPGNDLIRDSGGGDDYVAAGSGDDMVFAGDGLDLVLGEAGSDDLDSGLPSGYIEDGGPGVDTCALFGTGSTINCEQ